MSPSKYKVNLVLFEDFINHLIRLIIMVSQPEGHALLVGTGGSGRTSSTYLAAFISEMQIFILNSGFQEWKE